MTYQKTGYLWMPLIYQISQFLQRAQKIIKTADVYSMPRRCAMPDVIKRHNRNVVLAEVFGKGLIAPTMFAQAMG
jgi:hypothetical protein